MPHRGRCGAAGGKREIWNRKKRVWNFICRQTFPGRCNKTRENVGHCGEFGVAAEGGRHGVPRCPTGAAAEQRGVKGKGTTKKGLEHSSKPFFEVPSRIELLYAVLQTVA